MRTKNLENSSKKMGLILTAAATCFAAKGFHQTSMRDIATQAKMSLGGIYRYFDSKNAIILSFVEESNQESAEAFEVLTHSSNFKKSLCSLLKLMWKELVTHNQLGIFMEIFSEALRNDEVLKIVQHENSEEQLIEILKQLHASKKINLKLPPYMAGLTIMATIETAAGKFALDPSFKKKDAMCYIEAVVDLIIE